MKINSRVPALLLTASVVLPLISFAMPLTLDANKQTMTLTQDDCIRASKHCLLDVSPSSVNQPYKYYSVKQLCNGAKEYLYKMDLQDQLSSRHFLGREFCNGVVKVSSMDLPFTSHYVGVHNANDGILLMDNVEASVKVINKNLQLMKEFAKKGTSSILSYQERDSLNAEFTSLRGEIAMIANTTTFATISVLWGGNLDVPVHHDKSRIALSLPNASIGKEGLNIAHLGLYTEDSSKQALAALEDATQRFSADMNKLRVKRPYLIDAAKEDAVVTKIDVSKDSFDVEISKHRV